MGLFTLRNLIVIAFLAALLPHIRADCDASTEFECNDGSCINLSQKCNRDIDCSNGEDEEDCEDECNGFQCEDGNCISFEQQCDKVNDCSNGEDEEDCDPEGSDCSDTEISCDDNKCVPNIYSCDGVKDCEDGTDEQDCPSTLPDGCQSHEFQCANYECIDSRERCNGYSECTDQSDEKNCTKCEANTFHCQTSLECIPDYKQCDNNRDCEDGSDEIYCSEPTTERDSKQCENTEWKCNNGECINEEFLCDNTSDCVDDSDEDEEMCSNRGDQNPPEVDETIDTNHCGQDEFFCGGRCIEIERVCDGTPDCVDYSDEYNCTASTPKPECPEDKCADGTCIYQNQRCNGVRDCPSGEDEHGCPCRDNEFQCDDGSCIPSSQRCNRRYECTDGSDEQNCERCRPREFQCETGECISESRKCDRHVDCRDGSDENKCSPVQPLSPVEVKLNLKTYPNEQIIKERLIKEGREVVFQCRDEGPIRARVHWIRKNNRPLPTGTRDINGRLEIPNIQMENSGEYVCEAVGYPKSTPGSSITVTLTVEKYDRPDSRLVPQACASNQATCMNGDCISKSKICDGVFDCPDGSDENSCSTGRCEPNEFKCNNRKCVLKTWRCDGENDCSDGSDEEGCSQSLTTGVCRYDEFQCANRQCIPKSFQCDTQSDCGDNSDEIGCIAPAVITPPPPMVQLQAGVVFNITCRATGNPVPLIVWRLNWGHIPEKCTTTSVNGFGTLNCPDIQPIDSGAYSCEIINSMGTHFVSPDTILVVTGRKDICPAGKFNGQARREDDCISCFCFGVSTQCASADLFSYTLNPPVTSQTVVGVDGPWSGLSEISTSPYDRHSLSSTRHGVQFRAGDIPAGNRNYPYLSLPSEYHGNQLKSYGGFLRYEVEFNGRGQSNDVPDVIIQGNDYTLTYRHPGRLYPNQRSNITAQLFANNWYKLDGSYASREEIMMTLANVENILIKLQYVDGGERNVELLHVTMDSAALRNFGLGSANLVEECRCPAGYTGLSCEACDIGYVRQKTGAWLGRCVREEEPCRPGTYGDPSRGISCKACPCPVPGQPRARTCSLERNGDVTCHCDRGYTGRRCEECAPGFTGNPMSSRGCYEAPTTPDCNPYGTERVAPNGQCVCKPEVVGRYCDQCASGSYHLNPRGGCINCFCMGVTTQCTSSSLYRDTVRASFSSPTTEFALFSGYDEPQEVADRLLVENREVVYRNFESNDETFYWSLPLNFLGNKLTAYGGNLSYTVRYTPQPSGGASRSNSPDVVIVSGNEITLHHYRQDRQPPSGSQTFVVPMYEDHWQHYVDGTSANRPYLLMALANVTAIYIKATYTTVAEEAGLSKVELDIGTEQNYGSDQIAYEVEECQCKSGHQGLSCEDCAPGYFKGEQGLYLGLCEQCQCSGHSDECDAKTGACYNCRDNTEGDNCERCAPGFTGNATAGGCLTPIDLIRCTDCSNDGTASCDIQRRTCNCKPNVAGVKCDQCREGTFGLSEFNPYGCHECFCSGATRSCSAGSFSRDEIPLDVYSQEEVQSKFEITDREGRNRLDNDFEFTFETNEILKRFNDDSHIYYWNLPDRLRGNMILSYGGNIKITQRTDGAGAYVPDQDVIIKGNSITLVYTRPNLEEETYKIPLVETDWQTSQRSGLRPASRSDFLTVLSNVESILIRASLRSYTTESIISDISLFTAFKTPNGDVDDIEVCRCPAGYRGTSCEQCENLHYRDVYDRTAGLLGTCKMCPCENAASCSIGANRRVTCQCLAGWTGEFCRERAGTPPTSRPTQPPRPPPTIKVVINTPQIKIVEIGETTQFNCKGYYIINNVPVNIQWYKSDGRMSQRTRVDKNTLYIQDAQVDDSGIYICQAQIGSEVVRDNVTLTVGASDYPRLPEVTVSPTLIDQDENSVAEIRCSATGHPEPEIEWTRLDNYLSTDVINREGYLRFNSLRKSDEGTYRCHAQNDAGEADHTIQIYVRESRPVAPTRPPQVNEEVTINPDQYSGEPGQEIKLHCSSRQRGRVTWTKQGAVELPRNVFASGEELVIQYSTVADSGRYVCTIQFASGNTRSSTADVTVVSRSNERAPKIQPLEQKYSVTQGTDFELTCEVSGEPYPTVTWSLNGAQFASNARATGSVLRILNARPENSGIYVCLSTNSAGSDQVATVIDIDRRDPPVIELFPNEPQKLKVGESTRVSCRATGGSPYPTLSWVRRDGRPLSSRITEDYPGVITLREATLEDTGLYECRATSVAGTTSLNVNIEVQQSPTIISDIGVIDLTEGDELVINCIATGVPAPNVQIKVPDGSDVRPSFRPQSTRISHPEATINHFNVQRSNAGVYECIATSEAGQDLRYIQVNVNEKRGDVGGHDHDDDTSDNEIHPPHTTYRPPTRRPYPPPPTERPTSRPRPYPPVDTEVNQINPNQPIERPPFTVHLGERAELNCNSEDNLMRTEWRRADGRALPAGTRIYGSQMVIESVRNDAAGAYECLAYDQSMRPITLIIAKIVVAAGPPKITFSPPMPIVVRSGEDVIIYCNASGEQPMRVHWHSEGGSDLPSTVDVSGNYLRFNRIAPADEGRYVCTAMNPYGNTTKVAEVIVNHNVPENENYGRTKEAYEGDTVSLTCTDDTSRGRYSRYEWDREYESLPPLAENRENVLVLYNVRHEDGGRYICRTYTDDGAQTENFVDLAIKREYRRRRQNRRYNSSVRRRRTYNRN